jgi:hypothetical protein
VAYRAGELTSLLIEDAQASRHQSVISGSLAMCGMVTVGREGAHHKAGIAFDQDLSAHP